MNEIFKTAILLTLALVAAGTARAQRISSVYTDLAASRCRTLEVQEETGASVQSCPGIGGYKLLALDDDSRQSLTVIDPAGKKHELDLWSVVTLNFSSLGEKAEWRVVKKGRKTVPQALIVRVNASEDPANPNRLTSYLAVAKITPEKICVTNRIPSAAGSNEAARRAADSARSAACLKEITP